MKIFIKIVMLIILSVQVVYSAEHLKTRGADWNSFWICHPNPPYEDYGVFHFRKTFELNEAADSFIIHVSADSRYILFCNGKQVCRGPAKGDLENWRFETVDLSPYLKRGKNILSAIVWNFGIYRPAWQFSARTGFFIQGYYLY